MNRNLLRATLLCSVLLLAPACASIPLDGQPLAGCADAPAPGQRSPHPDYCQRRYLVVGLFPSVGEAHLNGLSTKGMPLTPLNRLGDYAVASGIIAWSNIRGFGIGTLYNYWAEPSESYGQSPGACTSAMLGFCKAALSVPRPTPAIPGEDAVPGMESGPATVAQPQESQPSVPEPQDQRLPPARKKRWTP